MILALCSCVILNSTAQAKQWSGMAINALKLGDKYYRGIWKAAASILNFKLLTEMTKINLTPCICVICTFL